MRGWIYRNVIFSFPTIFGGGDYILTLYFHPWQYLVRGWIYRDIIFSLLTIFGAGVIISWHYIFTPDNIWSGGDYIVTQYSHPWQYLVRGWLYRDIIFSLLTIFHEGVIISWNDILTPGNIWWGGIYILTYIFTPDNIWWGVIISWHYIFTPDSIWSGGDYIVTQYSHPWQYLVQGWLYRDIIFSLLTWQYFVRGWLYRDMIFSPLTIFGQGVIISWHYIFAPGNIWSGGDYIVTLYFHSWQYMVRGDYIVTYFHSWRHLVRGWLYHDIFSLLKIFGEGVIISWHYNIISDTFLEYGTGGDYI